MNGTVALFLLFYFLLFAESTEALHPQGVWKAQWARNSWPGGRDSPRRSSEEGRSFLMKLTEKRDSVLITYTVLAACAFVGAGLFFFGRSPRVHCQEESRRARGLC